MASIGRMSDARREDVFVVPRIVTERLVLRALHLSDFDAYAEHMADPVAMKHMTAAFDRRTAWRMFATLTGAWNLTGAGWWALQLRDTGEVVGFVGAFFRETQLGKGGEADLEIGWSVLQKFWRKGYAKEGARAALEYAFAHHTFRRVIAHVDPPNIASIGVCRAIGMTFDIETDFYGEPSARYAIARPPAPL